MSTDAVTPATVSPFANNPAPGRIPVRTLSQDDFLKLLVTQMTTQDPLNPQTDTQFAAQLAQFSSLEQSKAMEAGIAQLQTDQQLLQANSLIGRQVELQTDQDTPTLGIISAVQVQAGTPKLVVNGQAYDLSQLLSITPAATSN